MPSVSWPVVRPVSRSGHWRRHRGVAIDDRPNRERAHGADRRRTHPDRRSLPVSSCVCRWAQPRLPARDLGDLSVEDRLQEKLIVWPPCTCSASSTGRGDGPAATSMSDACSRRSPATAFATVVVGGIAAILHGWPGPPPMSMCWAPSMPSDFARLGAALGELDASGEGRGWRPRHPELGDGLVAGARRPGESTSSWRWSPGGRTDDCGRRRRDRRLRCHDPDRFARRPDRVEGSSRPPEGSAGRHRTGGASLASRRLVYGVVTAAATASFRTDFCPRPSGRPTGRARPTKPSTS